MNVAQYTFQSPSTSQVQVGRIDPSSVKEEKSQSAPANTNAIQNEANSFAATQVQEVIPTVDTSRLLDVYA